MIRFLQTPSPTKKIVLGALLVIICVMMVITLVPGGLLGDWSGDSGGRGTLARVSGQEVTTAEVQTLARQIGRRQFPRGMPPELMGYLMQNAANSLILQKALTAEADRMGLHVSDAELRDELRQGQFAQIFFPGGNFIGQEQYEDVVASNFSMSVNQFEQTLKAELMMRKLREAVAAGVAVSDADVTKQFQKDNTKVKLDYAVLTADDIKKSLKPTDTELKSFYDQQKARYENSIPEKRKAKYVVIDTGKVLQQVKASLKPEDIQKYYDQHKDEYKVPEQVKAAHILIKTPPPGPDGKVDPKAVEQAKAKAEDILKKLRAGADFAEMAKKESQDPGSAAKGGDLGLFQKGAMVPEFEQAAFSQPVGKIGDLVKTSFGFHIIKVESRQDAHVKPLDEVKDQIATRLSQEKANADAEALANKVETESRTAGIDKAASDAQLQLYTSDWFGRTDSVPGVGPSPEFMTTAFAEQKNGPPQVAKMAQGFAVVLVTDVKPPETPTFEQIRAKVEDDFKTFRAGQLLQQKVQELADRAHAEHDLKKAAKEVGATVKTSEMVSPTGQVPDLGSMSGQAAAAFDLKQGEISGPLNLGQSGAVLQVVQKQEASPEEFAKDKDQIREKLLDEKRQQRLQLFIASLRERMEKNGKIKINKDEWTRVMGAAPAAS